MDDGELVGGVLIDSVDPRETARQLAELLLAPNFDPAAASRANLHPDLVDVLRTKIGRDTERVTVACREGAAWVLGRRSVAAVARWDLVASLPTGMPLPPGLRRMTGETLVSLAVQAARSLRVVAPFMDRSGLSFLGEALGAATSRGVAVEILVPTRSTRADEALGELELMIRRDGNSDNFRASRLQFDAPWAHLKVMTCDSIAAYIGSANVTGAALAGRNLELGVLVRGPEVAVIEHILDLYVEH